MERNRGMQRWKLLGLGLIVAWTAGGDAFAAPSPADAAAQGGSFELASGVVIDPGAGRAFFTTPALDLQCVDLASGDSRWISQQAARPLYVGAGRLLAQVAPEDAERGGRDLALAVLDAGSGKKLRDVRVALPGSARSLLRPRVDARFELDVEPIAGSPGERVRLDWRYRQAEPTAMKDAPRADPTDLRGAVEIDLASGEATPAAAAKPGADREPSVAAAPWGEAKRAGDVYATIAPESGDFGRFVVRRWDAASGARLPDVPLEGARTFQLAAHGPYVVASRSAGAFRFRWSVTSLETGESVAELETDRSSGAFALWKSRLVYEARPRALRSSGGTTERLEPRSLVGVSLDEGERLWSHPLAGSEPMGTMPPAASGDGA